MFVKCLKWHTYLKDKQSALLDKKGKFLKGLIEFVLLVKFIKKKFNKMMPIKDQDIENQSNKNNILLSTMMGHQHQQQQQQQSAQLPTSNSLSKAEIRKVC